MHEDYCMRRHDRALPPEQSWNLLQDSPVGRLAMATPEGVPYVIPLNHVVCNKEIFIHCALKGRKLDVLRSNPLVCFEVDSLEGIKTGPRACDFSAYYESVIAFGEAYEVADNAKKTDVLNLLAEKYSPPGHAFERVTAMDVTKVTVIGIKVQQLTGKANPHKVCLD